ncbi:MAG: HEXXH motif-containing putative peptide modification protein, partial [Myxococcales bacterium]|nr:HEXXH motif-containing putative peptide modification protein [Myxococcales bacterium]
AREALRKLRKTIARVLHTGPGPIASLLRRPNIGGPLRCLRRGQGSSDEALAELSGQGLFELALARALPEPVDLSHLPSRLISLARRISVPVPEGTRTARFGSGTLHFDGMPIDLEAAAWRAPFRTITGSTVLAMVDNNPMRMFEAHPEKGGNPIDLGGVEAGAWVESLAGSLEQIGEHLPDLRAEFDLLIDQIVPVGFDAERHLSASYQEAIGTIYLTLHPGRMTMVEALVHEFSHNKLNALFELDPLLENAFHPLFRSPVRPDPRPLHGIVLAVHAFLPVARLYERMLAADDPLSRSRDFRERFATIIQKNREGTEVLLENAKPTSIGAGVFEEFRRLDAYFRELRV